MQTKYTLFNNYSLKRRGKYPPLSPTQRWIIVLVYVFQGHPVLLLPAFVEQLLVHRQKLRTFSCAKGKETMSIRFRALMKWNKLSYQKSRKSTTRFADHKSRKKICGFIKNRLHTATELPCSDEKVSFLQNDRTKINNLHKGFTTQCKSAFHAGSYKHGLAYIIWICQMRACAEAMPQLP